jgi:hypothetical protein
VVDTLSEYLDISTLKIGTVSHSYKMMVSGKGRPVLTFILTISIYLTATTMSSKAMDLSLLVYSQREN